MILLCYRSFLVSYYSFLYMGMDLCELVYIQPFFMFLYVTHVGKNLPLFHLCLCHCCNIDDLFISMLDVISLIVSHDGDGASTCITQYQSLKF